MNLDDGFPGSLKKEELIKSGCKKIPGMTYFELIKGDKKGIYEPIYNKDKEIESYTLRKVLNKE